MKRVAVIGAGASGLTAIKCCLDEGLEPVCFERSNYIGGLWHYTDKAVEGQPRVMKSTVINSSKETMCYSDFPIPGEFPNYMHNICVDRYFHMYADTFKLQKYIQFNTEVLSVKQTETFKTDGRWQITIRNSENKEQKYIFDGVLVCSGHFSDKSVPNFPGLEKFKGKVTHTHDYKDYHGYEDKRVLIIGIGNSGGDVATELSRISSQVYLSTRSGSWILNRVDDDGLPFDLIHIRRIKSYLFQTFPGILSALATRKLSRRFDHEKYCLKPKHKVFEAQPTINDELSNRIICGGVIVKANVTEFTETGAVFEDGSIVEHLDAVVLATGYMFGFPFLDKSIVNVKQNKVNLYKYMFLPDSKNHTLAIIGCCQPIGPIMPISEMQCRLATRVFKELIDLPNSGNMWKDIHHKETAMALRYRKSTRHTIQVDFVPFMDELAEIVGCKPNLMKLWPTDPRLAKECYFGPCTPYQYRLMGPGAWEGAREAILTQWKRIYQPLQTRPCERQDSTGLGKLHVLIVIAIAVLLYFIL